MKLSSYLNDKMDEIKDVFSEQNIDFDIKVSESSEDDFALDVTGGISNEYCAISLKNTTIYSVESLKELILSFASDLSQYAKRYKEHNDGSLDGFQTMYYIIDRITPILNDMKNRAMQLKILEREGIISDYEIDGNQVTFNTPISENVTVQIRDDEDLFALLKERVNLIFFDRLIEQGQSDSTIIQFYDVYMDDIALGRTKYYDYRTISK